MNAALRLLLAVVLASLPFAAAADDGTTQGTVEIGGWGADTTDSQGVISEYETTDDGVYLDLDLATHLDWGSLQVAAHGYDTDDLGVALDFDVKRVVRSHTGFDKLYHRLGHDPMTNLEATSVNGKVVFHTDNDPMRDFDLVFQVLKHRTELQFPGLSALTLAVDYREQKREGHKQGFTISHCDTCHVTSHTRAIEEITKDAAIEAKVAWNGGHIQGSFSSRELTQDYSQLIYTYDDALHPENQVPIFDNRLQYDSAEGPMAADLWPDMDKDTARLDLHLSDLGGFAVSAGGVWSETENRYTRLKSEYAGYMVNAVRRFGQATRLRWRGRVYSIDNDDVFVDTNERLTYAGPQAGTTYEDTYGVNYDWWRLSSLSRDVVESKLDLSYRISKAAGTIRLGWDYESIDRDHYQVLPGERETTTNTFGLSWRTRTTKALRVRASYRHAEVENPFMLVNGACSTLVSPAYDGPFYPETPQYDDQHQTRIAETTASPASWDEAKLGLSYRIAPSTTLSASYRYWDGDNTDGDLTDWSRTNQNATVTLWSAPAETWDWYLAYAWQDSELDAPVCIPVFDG